ncbi:response regulator transcription factor [Streptomyces iranensis]|uniref:Two component transcriptional regulator, wingedhelix family n=1 Tax=Streptomyces iranensis TaxID=576784 RepID=A0A060ZQ54_9ACTN|nr:response regulator transcription factor [Streptomyces iranensis]MBP2065849.1 two-component system KDP operon response regulator KdpE [Streptomyces iranensis]CDR08230.1 two component transcriptional regulator, wingedhelix family [Streptomyces iranensis]
MDDAAADRCEECGSPLPTPAKVGRRRRYCSDTCRSAARRTRRRAENVSALTAGPCATDIAGHACGRTARFAIVLNRRETRLCDTCYEVALDFLVGQGVSARDVRTVRLTDRDTAQPQPQPQVQPQTQPQPPTRRRPRVLLIEDDEAMVTVIGMMLSKLGGYEVSHALDGSTGLREAYARRPDLVLLDIMLPGIDGIEVLRRLRSVSDIPVIFLTARSDDQDLVIGLAAGADDYIVKPFSPKELLARMARVLRRHGSTENQEPVYEDGLLRLNSLSAEVHVVGKPLQLTPVEFRLLNCLVRNAGKVQPFEHLLATAWNDPGGRASTRVKFAVSRLRRKLDATPLGGDAIVSARGIGYVYRAPSTSRPTADAETPRLGHGHAGRILDILNNRENT